MKSKTRRKLTSLPLDPADFLRLISSIGLLANDPKKLRHYNRLAKTPFFVLTAIGGWSVTRSLVSYASISVMFLFPTYRIDAFGVFMLMILYSFGFGSYGDSMFRFYILRRLRANPESVTTIETEPLLALLSFLQNGVGRRSIVRYTWLAGLFSRIKGGIYYISLSSVALFVGSFGLIVASIWIAPLRTSKGVLVSFSDVGIYGITLTLMVLIGVTILERWMLDAERPVFIEEDELTVLPHGKSDDNPTADRDKKAP